MPNVIQQSVTFKVAPELLYDIYMDSGRHSAAVGAKCVISRLPGKKFTAFDGVLAGRNLLLVPRKMIVQSWRSRQWKERDPDSILILLFSRTAGGGRVDLVHVGVPDHDLKGVQEGWHKYYWQRWREYLRRRGRGAQSRFAG
jgi:activator of HSP90 ATPase